MNMLLLVALISAQAAPQAAAPPSAARRTPPAPATPALEGTVRTPDGKPIANALVLAQPIVMSSFREPALVGRTDSSGRFRITAASGRAHEVRVEAAGWAAAALKDVRPGAPVSVTLQKGSAIEGIVRDGNTSAPVAGAIVEARDTMSRVHAMWEPDAGIVRTRTDERGRFRIEGLTRGLHHVSARLRGYGRGGRSEVPAGGRVDLYLFPGATVTGIVRDADGRPVARAALRLESESRGFGPSGGPVVSSGPDGRFEVTGINPGTYRAVARHPDFAPGWVGGITVDRGAEADVEVVLARGVPVTGRLVAGEDKPVPGRIGVEETERHRVPFGLDDRLSAEAGADGRFTLTLPPGSYALAVVAPGYTPKRIDVEAAGDGIDVGDVPLEPGLVIRGRVRDRAGRPIADAQVFGHQARMMGGGWAGRTEARSDAEGAFVLGGLTQGLYGLQVSARAR